MLNIHPTFWWPANLIRQDIPNSAIDSSTAPAQALLRCDKKPWVDKFTKQLHLAPRGPSTLHELGDEMNPNFRARHAEATECSEAGCLHCFLMHQSQVNSCRDFFSRNALWLFFNFILCYDLGLSSSRQRPTSPFKTSAVIYLLLARKKHFREKTTTLTCESLCHLVF